ncbi:MAG: LacI family DNA-binding transcriptional regulator [Aristaeellaceae bacterium]
MNKRNNRRVKLTDIAAKTGFTVGTISKALQNKEGIALETRESIMKAAREIGYIANSQAGGLRSGSSKTVAIIVSDIANPLFAIEIKICVAELEKQGYRAIVMGTEERAEREEQAVISALNKNVDGVLLCPTQKSMDGIRLLQQNGMPFVLMGRRFDDELDADYVVCDDEKGGYLAGQHLAELGHERILVLTADPRISSSSERLRGFRRAMDERGVEIDPALVVEMDASASDSVQKIEEILASNLDFTAIFAFSDYIAWETIYALNSHGVRVPEDVSIVGFDDVQSHMRFPPPLTTVHFPKRTVSTRSVELLLEQIRHGSDAPVQQVLDAHLVVRGSTASPRKRSEG